MKIDKCFTCGSSFASITDLGRRQGCVRRLASQPHGSNTKYGATLVRMGVNVGKKKLWDTLGCCRICCRLIHKWDTLDMKMTALSQQWHQQTGKKLEFNSKSSQSPVAKQITNQVQRGQYVKAVTTLRRLSPAVRKHDERIMERMVSKEIRNLEKDRHLYPGSRLDWRHFLNEIKVRAPTVYQLFSTALGSSDNDIIQSRIGTMIMIALHHRKPRIHCLLPSYVSASLWKPHRKGRQVLRKGKFKGADCIGDSNYATAFKQLLKEKGFRKQYRKVLADLISLEVQKICHNDSTSVWKASLQHPGKYRQFNWKTATEAMKKECPVLYTALHAAANATEVRSRKSMKDPMPSKMVAAVATVFGILLHLHKPKQVKVIQEILGLQLWLGDCSPQVMKKFRRVGLCFGQYRVKNTLVPYALKSYDAEFKEKIKEIESTLQTIAQEKGNDELASGPSSPSGQEDVEMGEDEQEDDEDAEDAEDAGDTDLGSDSTKSDDSGSHTKEITSAESEKKVDESKVGYSLVFGEINPSTKALLHKGLRGKKAKKGESVKMVQLCAAMDRIPTMHLDDTVPSPKDLLAIDPTVYLPSSHDLDVLWEEYSLITQRILCKTMTCFKDLGGEVVAHIPHEYSAESQKASELIPLGTMKKNQTKVNEMADILETLHHYVPGAPGQGDPVPTPLYAADRQGCQRVRAAQRARLKGDTRWDRLEGLHPVLDEWQKHCHVVENTYKLLYDVESSYSVGSLAHIRQRYMQGPTGFNALRSSQHAIDLLRFSTEAYVIACACSSMELMDPTETPEGFPSDREEALGLLKRVATVVVGKAWQPALAPNSSREEGVYCICETDREGETMIECENEACDRGSWFHFSCINSDVDLEGNWYCSERCSHAVAKAQSSAAHEDHIHEYTRALLNRGLGEMVRHDAVCENDGDRMLTHWKFDMLDFFLADEDTNLSEGLSLLTDVNGGVSPRMAHQLRWNRTVNLTGGPGDNAVMDVGIQKVNKHLEEAVRCEGRSRTSMERNMQVGRLLGLQMCIDDMLGKDSSWFENKFKNKKEKEDECTRTRDIAELVTTLLVNDCVAYIAPGRCHVGFTDFRSGAKIEDKRWYLNKIKEYLTRRAHRLESATD